MSNLHETVKDIYRLTVMWAASATNTLFGGTDGIFLTLIIFMSADYITGVCAAIVNKQVSSRIGARGLAKKMGILCVVALATLIEKNVIDTTALRTAVILYYMQYRQVKDVMISLDRETLPLEDALKQGKLTEEDILYFARQDARTGFCKTEAVSPRGVTNFYFHYPEYSIKIIHDVQETPDGGQYLISQMHVYAPKLDMKPTTHFFDPETNEYLDIEDWGLTFDVQQVAPTGITFTCTQSAGQQIGTLAIKYYYLTETTGPFLQKAEGTEGAHFEALTLDVDGTSTFTIDWTEWYGSLPSGEYIFLLDMFDLFEPEQVPPLTVDFHTRQLYSIAISIP